MTDEAEAKIAAEIKAEVDAATDYAEAQPDPTAESGAWWVYADEGPADWVPPWRAAASNCSAKPASDKAPTDKTAHGIPRCSAGNT